MNQQLMTFVVVAEQRNFTRAAEILHNTQPAISQQIQALEKQMGTRLLERTNKSVQLNRAGQVVYEYAKQMEQLYLQMNRLVEDMIHDASGTLTIGASFTYGEYVLPRILADFVAMYPRITPSISILNTHDVVEHVGAGKLDVGLTEGKYATDEVIVEDLSRDTVVVVASSENPLTRYSGRVPTKLLEQETWLLREEGSGTREIADLMCHAIGISPRSIIQIGSTQSIKESVEAGLGIAVLSRSVIRKELKLGTLKVVPALDAPLHRTFAVVLKRTSFHTKATTLFQEYLRTHSMDV